MYYKKFQKIELSRLGMGNMRLPQLDAAKADSPIDYEKTKEILDYAIKKGITYFDTAYIYNNGDSERVLGKIMKEYPRDSYCIADKYYGKGYPDYKAVFEEQLNRLQTDHIDFYLCHSVNDDNADIYLENGCIDYFLHQKELGRIKYFGFSSHAPLEILERFASHHQWDFAQLQINYLDWYYSHTEKEYEILKKHNIPIMVMEPIRGGVLANLSAEARKPLQQAHPDWTDAKWALKFVQSLDQVQVILSGMSAIDQIVENIDTFDKLEKLNDNEIAALKESVNIFHSQIFVPCTGCRYCCGGCPAQINIPEYLKKYNRFRVEPLWGLDGIEKIESVGEPKDCQHCGNCMGHCPQNINTPKIMDELAKLIEARE